MGPARSHRTGPGDRGRGHAPVPLTGRASTKRSAFGLITALIVSGACSTASLEPRPGERVALTFDRELYSPGDTVHGLLHNLSSQTLETSLSLCEARLQRPDDLTPGQWDDVPPAPMGGVICTAQYLALGPHATAPFLRVVPSNAVGGIYRVLMPAPRAAGDADTATVASPSFAVGAVAVGARLTG
jgi:hypothetical protein